MSIRRSPLAILAIGTGLVAAVAGAGWGAGLRINMTPSYPRGLWRIETLDRAAAAGDLVFICPPDTAEFERAFVRGYIRGGLCAGGLTLLWHFSLRDICKEQVTVRTSSGWRSCEEVEDRLPDGRHAWLWWRS
ncbi:type IV secretory pathway protease TraF [Bradyrhizobium sp. USDA 10063]